MILISLFQDRAGAMSYSGINVALPLINNLEGAFSSCARASFSSTPLSLPRTILLLIKTIKEETGPFPFPKD